MARLLPLLFLLLAVAAFLLARQAARPRSDRVYRPRPSPFARRKPAAQADWIASRADVEDVRDAYSSETLDPQRPLFRCGGCQAWYHEASVRALDLDNGGRCALCGSPDLRAVRML